MTRPRDDHGDPLTARDVLTDEELTVQAALNGDHRHTWALTAGRCDCGAHIRIDQHACTTCAQADPAWIELLDKVAALKKAKGIT